MTQYFTLKSFHPNVNIILHFFKYGLQFTPIFNKIDTTLNVPQVYTSAASLSQYCLSDACILCWLEGGPNRHSNTEVKKNQKRDIYFCSNKKHVLKT